MTTMRCGHPDCANEADPRWWAYCTTCTRTRAVCDGHHSGPLDADLLARGVHPHPWTGLIHTCRDCTEHPSNELPERAARLLAQRRCTCGESLYAWPEAMEHAEQRGCRP